jgi:hypothetical protein
MMTDFNDFNTVHPRKRDGRFTTKIHPVGQPVDIVTEPEVPDDDGGTKKWWVNAPFPLHRLDGPAVEGANGDKGWGIHDEPRREDGSAVDLWRKVENEIDPPKPD